MTPWTIVDRHGVLHGVATWPTTSTHGLTRCASPFTHGEPYAKPWPSSDIVEKMTVTINDYPTCVHCVVKT